MKIHTSKLVPEKTALFAAVAEKASVLKHPFAKALAEADRKYLALFEKQAALSGEFVKTAVAPSGRKVVLFGLGDAKRFTHRKAFLLMRKMVATAKAERVKNFAVWFPDFKSRGALAYPADTAVQAAVQFLLADFEYTAYKEKPKEGWPTIEEITIVYPAANARFSALLQKGIVVGEETNKARALANTPGADMTPARLAEEAVKAGRETGFRVKILDEEEMKKIGMGGVLGVASGSRERPRFIVMEYFPLGSPPSNPHELDNAKSKKGKSVKLRNKVVPVVLVGKGVTFDTGGLNLKPTTSIYEMHMDMSGGAAVIHALAALARLRVKKNIVGLVPAVENMPSGSSYRPGDLLKTMSGKTIEVLDTDAEGRIILADALTYALRYKPAAVIDVATLTGAAQVALGQRATAIFSNDAALSRAIQNAGEATGDFLWPLPLWEEFENEMKGTFGDWANVSKTRWGGAITGAVFLWQFVKNGGRSAGENSAPAVKPVPWAHLDIAPRMTTIEGEYLAKGAAGAAVNALVKFLAG